MPQSYSNFKTVWTELKILFDLPFDLSKRVLADNPQLTARLRRTEWLRSAAGNYYYRSSVWFDGKVFHGVVYLHKGTEPSMKTAQVVWRSPYSTWCAANRAARKQAVSLATLKIVFNKKVRHP